MIYTIEFTKTALHEETEAYLYYQKEKEGLENDFLGEVEDTINNISQHPTHYSYSDRSKIFRDVSLRRFPFTIIYRIKNNIIIIISIHHTSKSR